MDGSFVNVLAIDSATPRSSVAIGSQHGPVGEISLIAPRGRHEAILPAIEQLLRWTDLAFDDIGGIAVGVGPGLFTGMRVGIEVAKSLSQVLGAPIIGASSLDVLAFAARTTRREIRALIDARRGEVYTARYQPVPGGVQRVEEPEVLVPEAVAMAIEATAAETLLVGNGALLYRDHFDDPRVVIGPQAMAYPSAVALAELTVPRFLREEHDDLFSIVPQYVRRSDAEIALDVKGTP